MILAAHSDAAYLNVSKSRSRAGAHIAKTPMAPPVSKQPLAFPFQHSRLASGGAEGYLPVSTAAAAAAVAYWDIYLSPFCCHHPFHATPHVVSVIN